MIGFKTYFTVVTLAIGFQGGEVTPLIFNRSNSGIYTCPIFHLPIELCVALQDMQGFLLQQQIHF